MESIVSSYKHLLADPQQLNSPIGFLIGLFELALLGVFLAWPVAIILKLMLSREKLGTTSRLQFTFLWTAILLGILSLFDVATLLALDRVSSWDAVTPHTAFSFLMGMIALLAWSSMRTDLKALRGCVDNARK